MRRSVGAAANKILGKGGAGIGNVSGIKHATLHDKCQARRKHQFSAQAGSQGEKKKGQSLACFHGF